MLENNYRNIVYFIALTITITIGAQIYWNVKNYQINEQQVINHIQISFDLAVEKYHSEIAKDKIQTLINTDTLFQDKHKQVVFKKIMGRDTIITHNSSDSMAFNYQLNISIDSNNLRRLTIYKTDIDSIGDIQNLSAKLMLSFNNNPVNLAQVDTIFKNELERKSIDIRYGFDYKGFSDKDSIINSQYQLSDFPGTYQSIFSQSSFIPFQSSLELRYTELNLSVFKRIFISIILSFILSGIIIGCLIFLLKIIFKQKQLSEVKNDLISNVTHEFKTPIATISAVMDSLQHFDTIKNPEKTKEYLSISTEQLKKLNIMVEKLLETSSLQIDEFQLNKERINLTLFLKDCIEKIQLTTSKKIFFESDETHIYAQIDPFHFENCINNILDNAVKYGGNEIEVTLKKELEIVLEDNGMGIPKQQQEKIFEQFYRIPTGNVHNVKGFGIGLYYTRKIIEKHGGTISASGSNAGNTVFKINLKDERSY